MRINAHTRVARASGTHRPHPLFRGVGGGGTGLSGEKESEWSIRFAFSWSFKWDGFYLVIW